MATSNQSKSHELFVALQHPLRRAILREMEGEQPVSPRELAARLKQPLSNVSYHVRVLAGCGAIELVHTQAVRGSTKHFYRASVDAEWVREALGATEG